MPEVKVKTFLFEYICKGRKYILEMPAYTEKEALERIKCVSSSTYLGERAGVIPFDESPPPNTLALHREGEP